MNFGLKQVFFGFTVILCASLAVNAQIALPSIGRPDLDNLINEKDVPNLSKVNSNLYRGGQPTEAGIKALAKMGVKTIIDLRDNDERTRKEEKWVTAAGLRFINGPLSNWFSPHDDDINGILKQIDLESNQPVYVHCKRGADRTGTVIAVYRISHDGWTGKQANAEAKQFGFGWWQFWMRDYINVFYRGLRSNVHKS